MIIDTMLTLRIKRSYIWQTQQTCLFFKFATGSSTQEEESCLKSFERFVLSLQLILIDIFLFLYAASCLEALLLLLKSFHLFFFFFSSFLVNFVTLFPTALLLLLLGFPVVCGYFSGTNNRLFSLFLLLCLAITLLFATTGGT